jgi:hypothetical protein
MTMYKLATAVFFSVLFSLPVRAEDFPGGEDVTSAEEFEKGFGETKGISEAEKSGADDDRLKIGGRLASDLYILGSGSRDQLSNPNTLWIYLDARLRHGIRAYVKARGVVEGTGTPAANEEIGSQAIPASNSDVEEMKLFFNASGKAFFTLGKQQVRWGSGKFWNPTDVLNATPRDFLYSDDRRSGVSLLKTHVPYGAANFYLVQSFRGATRTSELGHAARVEIPILISELALTAAKLPQQSGVFGADLSAGLGDFDVHGELAWSDAAGRPSGHTSWVAGASYELPYLDNDVLGFTLEYFRNADGVTSTAAYLPALATGAYVPFRLARDYALFMIYAPTPGNWNHTSLSLFNVFNLTDGSWLTKLSVGFTLMQDLALDMGVSGHFGNKAGELRLGDQKYDLNARVKVDF